LSTCPPKNPETSPIKSPIIAPPKVITKAASPYERTKSRVYATGNKWAIENFNATHN